MQEHAIPINITSPIRHIIQTWCVEFDRYHATERLQTFRTNPTIQRIWRYIREDIHSNIPIYLFDILTQSGTHIRWPLALIDCNPQKVHTGMRLPESHIVAWNRRAVTIPVALALATLSTTETGRR